MVLTKKFLFLGLEEKDEIKDYIPLHEIESVRLKQDLESEGDGAEVMKTALDYKISGDRTPARGLVKSKTVATYRFFNGFQIETVKNGFNSGRTYNAQAADKNECDRIVTTLQQYAKKARNADRNANRFERSQRIMLRLYNSFLFQTICAVLILGVQISDESFILVLDLLNPALIYRLNVHLDRRISP
jgi:hypothetical protein